MPSKNYCKVCNSPNRAKYEEMFYAVNQTINSISNFSKSLNDGSSAKTFAKHFKEHVTENKAENIRKRLYKPIEAPTSTFRDKLMSNFQLAVQLEDDLTTVRALINNVMNIMSGTKAIPDFKTVKSLATLLSEARQIIKDLPKLKEEIQTTTQLDPIDFINDIARLFAKVELTEEQIEALDQGLAELKRSWSSTV